MNDQAIFYICKHQHYKRHFITNISYPKLNLLYLAITMSVFQTAWKQTVCHFAFTEAAVGENFINFAQRLAVSVSDAFVAFHRWSFRSFCKSTFFNCRKKLLQQIQINVFVGKCSWISVHMPRTKVIYILIPHRKIHLLIIENKQKRYANFVISGGLLILDKYSYAMKLL